VGKSLKLKPVAFFSEAREPLVPSPTYGPVMIAVVQTAGVQRRSSFPAQRKT
jgi:hypothetical protein